MTPQQRALWSMNRNFGPIIVFVVLFFVLFKFAGLELSPAFIIAAVVAISDYVILSWLMNRMDQG
ncbi:hypothetical protein ACJ3XI_07135 [Litorimonas sp. RW-G-Af-16]|uniref:hypothetical protein n=1 Tax=Litorimonas sp. RW-G-Af-16 TaxID=3241168 RepID=UPI00390CCC16